jgi:hypothetical protein
MYEKVFFVSVAKNDCIFKLLRSCQTFVISVALGERCGTVPYLTRRLTDFSRLGPGFFLIVVHTILEDEIKLGQVLCLTIPSVYAVQCSRLACPMSRCMRQTNQTMRFHTGCVEVPTATLTKIHTSTLVQENWLLCYFSTCS